MPPKLGILAGSGELPARIIEECNRTGRDFFVIAFNEQTDPALVAGLPHAWVRLGAAGAAIEHLRDAGAQELVMAGAIRRPPLKSLMPDAWATKLLAKAGIAGLGDDGILRAIIHELEDKEGFRVIGPEAVVPGLLSEVKVYGRIDPSPAARRDIDLGIAAARGIGALDVGQSAAVRDGAVLALESADGTDAMLARCPPTDDGTRRGVLVKVRKPEQESRADLPTIGVATVRGAASADLAGIAVEAGGALIVDREAVVEAADAVRIFIVGVPVDEES